MFLFFENACCDVTEKKCRRTIRLEYSYVISVSYCSTFSVTPYSSWHSRIMHYSSVSPALILPPGNSSYNKLQFLSAERWQMRILPLSRMIVTVTSSVFIHYSLFANGTYIPCGYCRLRLSRPHMYNQQA